MMKEKIYNYTETTYGVKQFSPYHGTEGRLDVTYFARIRSKRQFLIRLMELPHMRNATANWIRERVQQGEGGMEEIIVDNCIYVSVDRIDLVIGKFTKDNKWILFDTPIKPKRIKTIIYPEHDKLQKVKDRSQTIGEFLNWLSWNKKIRLARFEKIPPDEDRHSELMLVSYNMQELLAEYFGIDLDVLEQEKRKMLEHIRTLNKQGKSK